MNAKWHYMIIGIFLGVIVTIVLIMVPGKVASQQPQPPMDSGSAAGMIALTTTSARTNTTILWLVDAKNENLLVYEFADDNRIKLKAVRDIQFDLAVPEGMYIPRARPGELTPPDVKDEYKKWADQIKRRKEEMKRREKPE